MLTVQMLTKNNEPTIRATFESLSHIKDVKFIVGDLGSKDGTKDICKEFKAKILVFDEADRSYAQNKMAEMGEGRRFWIEPWEAVVQGHGTLLSCKDPAAHVNILQAKTITKDVRIWDGSPKFVNPIFERLDLPTAPITNVTLYSKGAPDTMSLLPRIEDWKAKNPLSSRPYYYQSCVLLGNGRYDDFVKVADHYLFMDKSNSMSATMTRYYYAMVQLMQKRVVRPVLQNINLCLCARPLMAEFWCLMADAYYHLLHRFDHAKEFYENAMILGNKRLKSDLWPLDIPKYREYPEKMIESCSALMNRTAFYGKITP